MKDLKQTIRRFLLENQIEKIRDIGISVNDKIEGGFLNGKQAEALQREIESNYDDLNVFKLNDIRQSLYTYEYPLAERNINGVNLRITDGLIESHLGERRKTYLLYADGKIVGKFYKVADIKKVIKYIEDNLIADND
jgi:hypothetical protein